jgi:hypothetical protein
MQVFAIWAFASVLLAITRAEASWRIFEIVSAGTLVFFLAPFVEGPYRLYTRHSMPVRAGFRVFDGDLRSEFPEHRLSQLSSLGFEVAGYLVQESGHSNVVVHLALFIHAANKDSAQLARVMTGLGTISVLVFKSRFEDGFAFETSDSHIAEIFKPDPNFPVFRFPLIRSTRDLYRLHSKIKERYVPSHRPTLADKGGELAEFIARAEIVRQRHAQRGGYRLAVAGDRYLYTWRGAIRHSWLMAWPIKRFRMMGMQRKARKMAEELGLRIDPKFGCLEDSLPRHAAATQRRRL